MSIRVYNSLTNQKEDFVPVVAGKVGMYLCGPTVYKPSHIGHAVGPVIFDAIKRYLTYRGYAVTWVVNITDVDDKLIVEAAAKGLTVPALAEEVTGSYFAAMKALQVTSIDHFPKASEHIDAICAMIERLIAKGAAYEVNGDVYFDVTADADYGKLSNRQSEDQAGQRALQSGAKRNPGDFALWKAAKPEEPEEVKYASPWGPGRPGWHIECSAMAQRLLGETFDIHGGGLDLVFPHHENEIAQSETCHDQPFARIWMHHGLTRFNTKKVSKSDPQMQEALRQMTLSNLLEQYSGEHLRFFLLSTHYRRPIEYSPEELASKKKGLNTFYRLFERVAVLGGADLYDDAPATPAMMQPIASDEKEARRLAETTADVRERFEQVMDDDFNTAAALACLFDLANAVNRYIEQRDLETTRQADEVAIARSGAHALMAFGRLLGLFLAPPAAATGGDRVDELIAAHVKVRAACRAAGSYPLADRIRDGLAAAGVQLLDKADGTRWEIEASGDALESALVGLHLEVRQASREARDFAIADLVRDELLTAGVELADKAGGTSWQFSD